MLSGKVIFMNDTLSLLRSKKGFICDMDGVIYHGNRLLDGVPSFVEWLQKENKSFLFLTNSSERSPLELQQKLARMGLEIGEEHFYTSALATAKFVASQKPGASAYVIGAPGLVGALYEAGIVMNDVRYTNFDVRVYWKTQAFQYTNFHDVPEGVADKITIFPEPEQWNELRALIPPDFDISISEGVMWMLMNPQANKEHALHLLCERLDVPLEQTAAFGDDLIDINMMSESGRGVAVANANPKVLSVADEICPSNNEDGVAQWIEAQLG